MTAANELIAYGPLLAEMFDPTTDGFEDILRTRPPLETAVLSVLTGRRIFWVTHSLAFGHAVDSGQDALENAGRSEYGQLFGTEQFDAYIEDSGFNRQDATLLNTARVLDSFLNTDARMLAMRGTVRQRLCIQRCPAGDSGCVRRCITRRGSG
jgi:hypothetical protein